MPHADGSVAEADAAADSSKIKAGSGGMGGMLAAGSGGVVGAAGKAAGGSGGGGVGGVGMDAGPMQDAGATDAGATDAGTIDSGAADSGPMDAGVTDSGAPDAGPVDSGTPDSGTTDPVDPIWTEDCPNVPGVIFCDDFEGGLGKWDYTVHTRGSTAVSTDYKHGASYSFRASTSASTATSQSQARRGVKAFGHRKSGDLWARYFYYLPSSVSVTQKFSTGVISEYEQPWLGFSVLVFPDGIGIESLGTSRKVNTSFPRNQWVCIEMHVLIDPSAGAFEFFMNGSKITSLIAMDTLPDQGYTSFEVGVHYADFYQGAITAYTDDVKLGTSRLGCN
jgi:hypothetical protein